MSFFQDPPTFGHPFQEDIVLKDWLQSFISSENRDELERDLDTFGKRLLLEVDHLSKTAEKEIPEHIPFDPWGKRIDEIKMSPAWNSLHAVSAEEGIVATGYENKFGPESRILQMMKLYLFHPSSAFYTCPLAMTDGAAKLLKELGNEQYNWIYDHLTSRDPEHFWTSGQWMTERTGGSDVGRSETIARFENGEWRLYGTKWFTSATTSEMTMALARVEENGKYLEGSRGLGLFFIELRESDGSLNKMKINRLKDKLGTKGLPTAEIELVGTKAKMIAPAGKGVKTISYLFNVTRIYNAVTTIGSWRRLLTLQLDYAKKRVVFGKTLKEQPAWKETIADLLLRFEINFHLTMKVAHLLGLEENQVNKDLNQKLLRLLTPIAKLKTAKENMQATSELIESFGGAGYVEDTGLPKFLRDSQVFPIWEGATNVLSLDMLRAFKVDETFPVWMKEMKDLSSNLHDDYSFPLKETIESELSRAEEIVLGWINEPSKAERQCRKIAFFIGELTGILSMATLSKIKRNERIDLLLERWHFEKTDHSLQDETKLNKLIALY